MYPERLPTDGESAAERLLYELFSENLPGDFVVMHSVKWLLRDRSKHDRDGEIDFLVAHRDLGVLVLEVKGGRLRVDGSTGHWYSMDRHGKEHRLKESPFDQARKNLYNLMEKLGEAPRTRPYRYRLQRGVAMPDVNVGSQDVGVFGDRGLIIDSTDLGRIEGAVRRVLGRPLDGPAMSKDAFDALVATLSPTLEIHRLGLGHQVLTAERQIAILTENQFAVLDSLQFRPRAVVTGCAGSGKTMLAMEKARRLADEGFTVLFTCFNKNLARWVRERFANDPGTVSERIYVSHYHGLVADLCRRAGVVVPVPPPEASPAAVDYHLTSALPEAFADAIDRVPVRFDAVIADEGQDFADLWWLNLLDLLRDREQGVFYIFYDDNQRIYRSAASLPIGEAPFPLILNCRNTDLIHEQVLRFYQGSPKPRSRGPEGIAPEFVAIDGGERNALRRVFGRLFEEERLPTTHVVLLTPRGAKTSGFREGDRIGNVTLTWEHQAARGEVRVCSIHAFKGLESPVIILGELDRLPKDLPPDYLMYVALSRARDHLVVLGDLPAPSPVPSDLGAWRQVASDQDD